MPPNAVNGSADLRVPRPRLCVGVRIRLTFPFEVQGHAHAEPWDVAPRPNATLLQFPSTDYATLVAVRRLRRRRNKPRPARPPPRRAMLAGSGVATCGPIVTYGPAALTGA